MKAGTDVDPDAARHAAQRRLSEDFEAQRTARRRTFYDDDPNNAGAKKPAAGEADAAASKQGQAEETKAAATALELDAPAGVDPKDPTFTEFRQLVGDLHLSPEAAQKLLELRQVDQVRARDASMDAWESATRTDREIGGDRLEGAIADAREALERHGTPELRDLLDESGLGSHPEILRLLARVVRATRRSW
jgi:Fe-S-cluster formation regulator IscX/YfhJ